VILYDFLEISGFKRKDKTIKKEKRLTGRIWPIEAGRAIEKTGLRVSFLKV
jgi:hypothetical protein